MRRDLLESDGKARRFPVPLGSLPGFGEPYALAPERVTIPRVDCVLCRRPFAWDSDESWNKPPEEIEVVGRRFLGIGENQALCPECLGDVEVAGAERMYWALSQSL